MRLQELQKEGLIERFVDPEDNRVVWYNLTKQGRDAVPILSAFIQYGSRYHAQQVFEDGKPRTLKQLFPGEQRTMLGPLISYAKASKTRALWSKRRMSINQELPVASSFETILVQKKDPVSRIILNRPDVLNAVNEKMGLELDQALQDAEDDRDVHCLVLTGAGRAFCAGEDVADFRARNFMGLDRLLRRKYHPIIRRMRLIRKPIIAAINGVAAGGGASLALLATFELRLN